jgi:hypothetical protein
MSRGEKVRLGGCDCSTKSEQRRFHRRGLADGTITREDFEEARAIFEARGRSSSTATPIFDSKVMSLRTIERECASIAIRAAKKPRAKTVTKVSP